MINYFLHFKTKNLRSKPPSIDDIINSKTILFSIFTRYGDTVINLVVIKEFMDLYPDKEYLIICPKQMKPYVNEILPKTDCFAFNKRNPIDLYKLIKLLKFRDFDVGFNPWSNGLDSNFFLSFSKKFLIYRDFDKPQIINHYQVIRTYLKLPEKDWKINEINLKKNYKKILICPQSTDIYRNIPGERLDKFIDKFNKMYNFPEITIASMDESFFRGGCKSIKLEKSASSSRLFLSIMKQSSLIVCSDSGPLHIALSLNKNLIAYMRSTKPQDVINTGSSVLINIEN
jgi:ADP-heptose:LPS heptosyltransferase